MRLQAGSRGGVATAGGEGSGPRVPAVRVRARGGRGGGGREAGGSERRRPTSAAGRGIASPASLALPKFGPNAPGEINAAPGGNDTAALALALLDAGILRPEDWQEPCGRPDPGYINASISAGLERWLQERVGAGDHPWSYFRLSLTWTNDAKQIGAECYGDIDVADFEGRLNSEIGAVGPVCGIALGCGEFSWLRVGKQVLAIERRMHGAGFALLNLVQWALTHTVGCNGPAWVEETLRMWDGDYTDEEAEEMDVPTLVRLDREVPNGAMNDGRPYDYAFRVREAALLRWNLRRTKAFRAAVELVDFLRPKPWGGSTLAQSFADEDAEAWIAGERPDMDDQLSDSLGVPQYCPVGIQWTNSDIIQRAVDDWYDGLMQTGEYSSYCWFRAFQPGLTGVGSVTRAFTALEGVLKVLGWCDTILTALESDDEEYDLGRRQRVRV